MKRVSIKTFSIIANYLGLWRLLYWLYPIIAQKYILGAMTFHRVIPREKAKGLIANYDIGQDQQEYETILAELSHYFDFVGLDDFVSLVSGEKQVTKHSLLITFDDADHDFMEYALPLLKEEGWPSVVFAPTGYIDTDERFWHLRISNMMSQMDDSIWQKIVRHKSAFSDNIQRIISKYPRYYDSMCYPICRDLIAYLNGIRDDDIIAMIDKLDDIVGMSYTLGIKCMDWDHLRSLEDSNIAVEAHSITHRKLNYLSESDVLVELQGSKSAIESALSKCVQAFCYPAGSYNESIGAMVESVGYKVAFSTESGLCNYPLTNSKMFSIPRFAIEGTSKTEIGLKIGKLILR